MNSVFICVADFGIPCMTFVLIILYILFPTSQFFLSIMVFWSFIVFVIFCCLLDGKYKVFRKVSGMRRKFRRYLLKRNIKSRTYHPDVEGQLLEVCPICLEDVFDDLEMTKCMHIFHKTCLDAWESNGPSSCPCCRFERHRHSEKEKKK